MLFISKLSFCKSMHSYDVIIDLSDRDPQRQVGDRDTIKQDKPRTAGSRCGSACYNELQ